MKLNYRLLKSLIIWGTVILSAAAGLNAAKDKVPENPDVVWITDTGFSVLNPPSAADLNEDGITEIILTDVEGQIGVFSGGNGQKWWSKKIGSIPFTSAVVGKFLSDLTPCIAVAGNDGKLYLFNANLGTDISVTDLGGKFNLPPTLVEIPKINGGGFTDAVAVVNEGGDIYIVEFDSKGKGNVLAKYETHAQINLPLIADNIISEMSQSVLAVTRTGDLIVVEPSKNLPPIRYSDIQNTGIQILPALADFTGDEKKEIIAINSKNFINIFTFQNNELARIYSEAAIDASASSDLTVFESGKENKAMLAMPTAFKVYNFDLATKTANELKQNITGSKLISKPALMKDESDTPYMAISDESNSVYIINLLSGDVVKGVNFPEQLGKVPIIFAKDKTRKAVIVYTTQGTSKLVAFKTDIILKEYQIESLGQKISFTDRWITWGGDFRRAGRFDTEYNKRLDFTASKSGNERLTYLENAKKAISSGEWKTAIAEADKYLQLDSQNIEAQKLRQKAWIRKNIIPIAIIIILIILLFAMLARRAMIYLMKAFYLKKAESLITMEKHEEASLCLRQILSKTPNHKNACLMLVNTLERLERYFEEDLKYFENALKISGHQPQYVKLLASAYSNLDIVSEKSLEILLEALDMFDDKEKSGLEYVIAKCYKQQSHYELAAKYLRSAIRSNPDDMRLYETLCDVYLEMKQHTSKALPTFEKVYQKRKDNIKFLEAICEAYIDAKKTSDSAKSACIQTISLNPNFIPAYIHLARIEIQSGKIQEAINYANKILIIDAEKREGIMLLCQCYLIDGKQDKKALDIYLKALTIDPENPDLLKIVSQIYYSEKKFDDEAKSIYLRTYKALPNDVSTLFALAKINEQNPDYSMIIPVIEKLIEQNQAKPQHLIQLAEAYAQKNMTEPKTERIYKEALKSDPENKKFIAILAETLCQQKRDDAEAASFYEKSLRINPKNFNLGKQLAITYCKLGRFTQAVSISSALLKVKPDDSDLKRNYANASLHDNKLDEAIKEYLLLIEKNKDDNDAIVNLAMAYAQKRLLEPEAITIYQKAQKIAPENEDIYLILAYYHLKNGDTDLCAQELGNTIKAKAGCEPKVIGRTLEFINEYPEELKLRWFLASLLINSNRLREAIEQLENIFETDSEQIGNIIKAYDKIIQKDSKNAQAYLNRGVMYKVAGDFDQSKKNLETAYDIMPNSIDIQSELRELYEFLLEENDNNETRYKLGKLYFIAAEFDKAIGCFQKTSQHFKWESESIKMLGKCFMGKGMLDLALQEFKKLIIDDEVKDLFYDLAQKFENKKDLVGAKTVYKILFAADINYRNVKAKFEMLAGSTSDPITFEKTAILSSLSEATKRRYELLEEVGRGAMGIVYKAKDKELDEVVALKILPDSLSNNPEAVSRFKSEARSARRLSHKNIVRIHDIGEELGRKYISMEFVDGIDLKKKLKQEGFAGLKTLLTWFYQIADALSYAHSIGIIHRDIKPANIMITKDGNIKVTDFGIAKIVEGGEATVAGAILGTPIYMSPEQIQGIPVDNRADIYSFGIMMYEACSGHPPFVDNLAYQHLHTDPAPLSDSTPKPLQNIIYKCLKKKKEDRWKTAEEIAIHLTKLKESAL